MAMNCLFLRVVKIISEKYKPKIVMELAPYLYKENGYKADDLFKIIKSFRYNFYDVQNYEKIHSINEYSIK